MDFAKKMLSKYGWKEGDGLGKNNDGMNKALKPSYKFNKNGLGHNQADELNNHWWEDMYNKASENMEVNKDDAGVVSMDLKTGESVEITTKNYSIHTKADKDFYKGHFLRTSTLVRTGEEIEVDDKDVVIELPKVNPFKTVTDEDLLRACQGRTVHKGARHGIKMSGKLARIEEQERLLLAKMGIAYTVPPQVLVAEEWSKVKKNKRKHKETAENVVPPDVVEPSSISIENTLLQADYQNKSKKKAKKQRKLDEEMANALAKVTTDENESVEVAPVTEEIVKKKKNKKSKSEPLLSDQIPDIVTEECATKKSSRKRKREERNQQASGDSEMIDEVTEVPQTKRKKSSKKRKDFVDPSTTLEAEHFKKAEDSGQFVADEEQQRREAKLLRKKERQMKRLAKQVDQQMCIA